MRTKKRTSSKEGGDRSRHETSGKNGMSFAPPPFSVVGAETSSQKAIQLQAPIQRDDKSDKKDTTPSGGELAWEIFSPLAKDGIRSLAPGVLKLTPWGSHHSEVIDIADKLEDSYSKIKGFEKQIEDIKKNHDASTQEKFALKSIGKVYAHVESIPDAIKVSGEDLTNEVAAVVTDDFFSPGKTMSDHMLKLDTYVEVIDKLQRLKPPYRKMIGKLENMEQTSKASSDGLGILADYMLDLANIPVPAYQSWAFGMYMKISDYRRDVNRVRSALRRKREGYEYAIAAADQMDAYYNGNAGRSALENRYRSIKQPGCLAVMPAAALALPGNDQPFYENVAMPYDFEDIIDAVDFLDIYDESTFYNILSALVEAYPDRASTIYQKMDRYQLARNLLDALDTLRPALINFQATHDTKSIKFVFKEYYQFWVDDHRNLLSNTMFTYNWQISSMIEKAYKLPFIIGTMQALRIEN